MMTKRLIIPLLLLALGSVAQMAAVEPPATRPSSTRPDDVTAALGKATGLALIEVTKVSEQDNRPADGNFTVTVQFKKIHSTGEIPDEITIVKAYGGLRMGGTPEPIPHGPLYPNPLQKGERYYILFHGLTEQADWNVYPQGVVAWWPEKTAPAEVLDKAISGNKYKK